MTSPKGHYQSPFIRKVYDLRTIPGRQAEHGLAPEDREELKKFISMPDDQFLDLASEIEHHIDNYHQEEEERRDNPASGVIKSNRKIRDALRLVKTEIDAQGFHGTFRYLNALNYLGSAKPDKDWEAGQKFLTQLEKATCHIGETYSGRGGITSEIPARLVTRLSLSLIKYKVIEPTPRISPTGRKIAQAVLRFAGYPVEDARKTINTGYSDAYNLESERGK